MKLYEISKQNVLVRFPDQPFPFLFHHIDGMYSYCTDVDGAVFHPAAFEEVEIVDMYPRKDWGKHHGNA